MQLIEQRFGLFQIERVEALGEPSIDRSEKFAGLVPLALIAPEASHAQRGAKLSTFCVTTRSQKIYCWDTGMGIGGEVDMLGNGIDNISLTTK